MSDVNVADEVAPGIFVIRFKAGQLDGDHAAPLAAPLLAASAKGPLVLIADLPPGTSIVPPSLPTFFLNLVVIKGLRLRAIGVIKPSLALRVAMKAFQSALQFRNVDIAIGNFPTEAELVAWAKALP